MFYRLSVRPSSGLNYSVGRWDWYSPLRSHYNLWVSYAGKGVLTVNDEAYNISPGFALLLHPEDTARGNKPIEVSFCNIALHFDFMGTPAEEARLSLYRQRPTRLRNLGVVYELTKYMTYLIEMEDAETQAECDSLGAQIMKIFVRDWELGPEDPMDERIRGQSEVLRNHPERAWTLANMSSSVGLSVSQFTRRFTRLFQTSPNAFVIEARIEKARDLLRESTLSINEISDILGYADVAFFSRQFKAIAGVSPKAFRKNSFGS